MLGVKALFSSLEFPSSLISDLAHLSFFPRHHSHSHHVCLIILHSHHSLSFYKKIYFSIHPHHFCFLDYLPTQPHANIAYDMPESAGTQRRRHPPRPWQPQEGTVAGGEGGQAPGDLGRPVPGAAPGCGSRVPRAGSRWAPRWGSLWLTLDPSPRERRAQVERGVGKRYFEETWVKEGCGLNTGWGQPTPH